MENKTPTPKEPERVGIDKDIEDLRELLLSFQRLSEDKERDCRLIKALFTSLLQSRDGEINENTSDGYHTFKELYEHRITLYIALCKSLKNGNVWRAKLHSDGTSFEGWFILGIWFEKGKQITYHLPLEKWDETNFAQTLEKAPDWDGHTSKDVLERIKKL